MRRFWIVILLAVPAAVLGYGYWFGATHGALYVSVLDTSAPQHSIELTPVELSFLDAAGHTLAEARGGPPYGTIFLDTWWLWWVPLRHIGGKRYTSFTVQIPVDRQTACAI